MHWLSGGSSAALTVIRTKPCGEQTMQLAGERGRVAAAGYIVLYSILINRTLDEKRAARSVLGKPTTRHHGLKQRNWTRFCYCVGTHSRLATGRSADEGGSAHACARASRPHEPTAVRRKSLCFQQQQQQQQQQQLLLNEWSFFSRCFH